LARPFDFRAGHDGQKGWHCVRHHSKRVGITLYGDWDGRMARDYQMKENESNFLIIDRKGIIRYVSFGRITDEQFQEIEKLLDILVNGEG